MGVKVRMRVKKERKKKKNIPITPDLPPQLLRQPLKVLLLQLPQPGVCEHHAPSHHGCDLSVKVQPLAQVQQGGQVPFGQLPRPLSGCFHVPSVVGPHIGVSKGNVGRQVGERLGRARGHEGVAAGLGAADLAVAFEQPGHVVHAGFLETFSGGEAGDFPRTC